MMARRKWSIDYLAVLEALEAHHAETQRVGLGLVGIAERVWGARRGSTLAETGAKLAAVGRLMKWCLGVGYTRRLGHGRYGLTEMGRQHLAALDKGASDAAL